MAACSKGVRRQWWSVGISVICRLGLIVSVCELSPMYADFLSPLCLSVITVVTSPLRNRTARWVRAWACECIKGGADAKVNFQMRRGGGKKKACLPHAEKQEVLCPQLGLFFYSNNGPCDIVAIATQSSKDKHPTDWLIVLTLVL